MKLTRKPTTVSQPAPTSDGGVKAHAFPVGPLVGVVVVVLVYFGSQLAAQILISLIPQVLGYTPSQIESWMKHSAALQFGYILAVEALTLFLIFKFMKSQRATWRMIGLVRPKLFNFAVSLLAFPIYMFLNFIEIGRAHV